MSNCKVKHDECVCFEPLSKTNRRQEHNYTLSEHLSVELAVHVLHQLVVSGSVYP